jgi:hypothetical protein
VVWSQAKGVRCDPTSTAHAGGSPDPPLFTHHDPSLSALGRRVRSIFPPATRPTRVRAHPPVPTIPAQGQAGLAVRLYPVGVRAAVLVYPHAEPQNRDRTHSVSPARAKAASDPQPGGSQSIAGISRQAARPRSAVDPVWQWTPRSEATQLKPRDIDARRNVLWVRQGNTRRPAESSVWFS